MKVLFFKLLFLLFFINSFAQELEEEKAPFLPDVKISKIEMLAESSEHLILSIDYNASTEDNYLIKGVVLDQDKKINFDMQSEVRELSSQGGTVDLYFTFDKVSKTKYLKPRVLSEYIKIYIAKGKEVDFDNLINKKNALAKVEEAFAIKYVYKYEKQWRCIGCAMQIEVTLKPIGKAAKLKGL